MNKNTFCENKICPVIVGMVAVAIALIPCYASGLFEGHDMPYHVIRVESIYDGIVNCGSFKSYIYSKMFSGYGYASGIFYPDFFLYPAVALRLAGASIPTAIKALVAFYFAVAALTSYKAGKYIADDARVGAFVMVLYTAGNYHMLDAYIRSAMGELAAMMFIPLVFMGLYDLTERGYKKKGLLFIAFAGLMLSHTLSLMLCGLAAIIWCLVRIKKVLNKKAIVGVICEALATLVVTSFYWVPVLEQLANDTFCFTEDSGFYLTDDLMTLPRIYGGIFSISFMELAIMVLLIAVGMDKKCYSKKALAAAICAVGLLVIETGIFPWGLVEKTPLASLQFPWRLNMFTELFAALAIGCQLKAMFFNKKVDFLPKLSSKTKAFIPLALCMALGLFQALSMFLSYMPEEYIDYSDYSDYNIEQVVLYTITEEWMPVAAAGIDTSDEKTSGKVVVNDTYYDGTYNDDGTYTFVTNGISGTAEFPKFYYKGYVANVTYEDGTEETVQVIESANGLVEVELTTDVSFVTVSYEGTNMQKCSAYISLASLLLIIIFMIFFRRGKANEE